MNTNSAQRNCQNCKQEFIIEPADFAFYESMKVPAPTFCPDCRLQRKALFRNTHALYKRPCGLCGKQVISMYHPDVPLTVYCNPCWWGDGWDAGHYGKEYDFSKPFFEQWKELRSQVPVPALNTIHHSMVNSEYNNYVGNLKNCYLLFNSDYSENCSYGTEVENCKDCFDNMMVNGCELSYENLNCFHCYQAFYSVDCESSRDIWFSRNLSGCSNCVGCTNLRNKQYHIFNVAHPKEQYEEEVKKLRMNSSQGLGAVHERAEALAMKMPRKYIHGRQNTNVSGDYIDHCNNVSDSYIMTESQNCKWCISMLVKPVKDCYDYVEYGDNAERVYECITSGAGASRVAFSFLVFSNVSDLQYCAHCHGSSNLFGCIGMRKKSFSILNKQYSEQAYRELLPKIVAHMNEAPYRDARRMEYRYGEFFPAEFSAFAYNESTAPEYAPLTREQALAQGYRWRDPEVRAHAITVEANAIPETITDVADTVTNEVVGCTHNGTCNQNCTLAFRITANELAFYRRMNLPLPTLCPNCRHWERLTQRNPFYLWERGCDCGGNSSKDGAYTNTGSHSHGTTPCPNIFQTTYAPERPEIVYCEQCYQQEIV